MNNKTKPLIRDILVNFIGAFLGIIVTFGTTAYIDYRAKQDRYKRIIISTIKETDFSIRSLEAAINDLKATDSLYTRVVSCYPDHLHEISRDTLNLFIQQMSYSNYFSTGGVAHNIFKDNMAVLEEIDNFSLIYSLYGSISGIEMMHDIIDDIQSVREELFAAFSKKKHFDQYPDAVSAVKAVLDIPEIYNFLLSQKHTNLCIGIEQSLEIMKQINQECKNESGLTDEDFEQFQDEYNFNFD